MDFLEREKEYLNTIEKLTFKNEFLQKQLDNLQDEEKRKLKEEKAERDREQRETNYKKDSSINWGAILLLIIPALIALITSWTQNKKEPAPFNPEPPKAPNPKFKEPNGPFYNF